MKYGFIGCGNMGSALARAVAKSTKDILLCDNDESKAKILSQELGVKCGSITEVAEGCERIFLGVKPQMMADMLGSIADVLAEKKPTLITMAAGLKTDAIAQMVGVSLPVIRIMPNTPVSVGKGVVLYCANGDVSESVLDDFVADMQYAGLLDKIDEDLIDAGCSVSGCGPAYMYMFAEAMAKGGIECGLDEAQAIKYAAATMAGAAQMLLESDKTPEDLRIAVCSPGGSTIEGVKVLQNSNFYTDVANCIKAAYKRNIELGK